MKRYRLVYRGSRNAFYCFDTETNKRESLGTGNTEEAQRLIDTKNEAVRHSGMNLQIAQVYLQHSDPTLSTRTWQNVMDAKTGVPVVISFGPEAAGILQTLPKIGNLFPGMARIKQSHRAKMFIKRLKTVNITGISLHSYRYAWAERAKTAEIPER